MASDGSLKFDTKINTDGFEEGTGSLLKAAEKLTAAIENLSVRMDRALSSSGAAAASTAKQVNEMAESAGKASEKVDGIAESAKKAKKEAKSLEEQMAAITIEHYEDGSRTSNAPEEPRVSEREGNYHQYGQEVQRFVDEYVENMGRAENSTNEFKQEIVALETKLKELEGRGLYFGDDEYDQTYMKLAKVKQALSDYKKEMLSPTPDAAIFPADSLQGKIERLKTELKNLEAQGKTFGDGMYNSTYQALNKAQADLKEYKSNLTKPVEIPVRFDENSFKGQKQRLMEKLAALEKQGASFGNLNYDSTYAALQRVIQAEREYKQNLLGVHQGQKKVSKSAHNMGNSVKRVKKETIPLTKSILKLSNIFKLMLIRMSMRAAIQAAKDGFENIAQYSGETNKSISLLMSANTRLKNSFATAFAPALNAAAPALKSMIDLLSKAATYAGQLITSLTGKSTFVKAVDVEENYAESVKKTNKELEKKEKENKKIAFSFDDLIQAQEKSQDLTTEEYKPPTPDQMFETVEIESDIKDFADTVRGVLLGLFNPMKQSWDENGSTVITSAKYALGELKNLGGDVGNTFMIVWEKEGYGKAVTDDVLISVSNLLYTVGNLSSGFDQAWEKGDTGLLIMRHLGDLLLEVTGFFRDATGEIKIWSATLDFSPLLKSLDKVLVSSNPIVNKIGKLLLWLLKDILLPLAKWGLENGLPAVFELIAAALDVLNSVLDALQPTAMWLWDEFLQPLGKWAGEIFIAAIQKIVEWLTKFSDWINRHEEEVRAAAVTVAGFFAAWKAIEFIEKVKKIIDILSSAGGFIEIIKTLVSNLDKAKLSYLGIAAAIGILIGAIYEIRRNWNSMTVPEKVISSILAAASAAAILAVAVHAVKGVGAVAAIGVALAAGVAAAMVAINAGKRSSAYSSQKNYGTYNLSSLGDASGYRMPRLATGTVVPPRAGEFAAILGDNNRDTEIVSPIPAMKQAFKEAIEEMGGLSGGNQTLRADLIVDGMKFGQLVYKFNNKERQRVGVRMVTEG